MVSLSVNLLNFNYAFAAESEISLLPPDIFKWAIGIGILLALGSIIYAGIVYMVSAGNESYQKEAMERIKGAVFGLILLISGWLILYTLNPDILRSGAIKIPEVSIQEALPPAIHGLCCQINNPTQICKIDFSNNTCGNCSPCPTAIKQGRISVCVGDARGARCIEMPSVVKKELGPKPADEIYCKWVPWVVNVITGEKDISKSDEICTTTHTADPNTNTWIPITTCKPCPTTTINNIVVGGGCNRENALCCGVNKRGQKIRNCTTATGIQPW